MTDTAPVIASPNDIDAAFADRAFVGTSWTPERRGYLLREDYANDVNKFYAEVWPRAQTPEQKTLLGTEMERYRDGALARMKAYLASHANVVSSFIAGPSKFPAERMRKRGAAADRKMEDLLEWRKKAKHSIIGKLRDARTPEMRTDEAWEALRRTLSRAKGGETSAKTSVFGKLERLAANGEHELVGRALDWLAHQTLASGKVVPLSTGLDRVRMNDALRGNGWGTGDSTGHGYGHSGWENGDGQGYGWSGGGYSGGSGRSHGDDAKQSTDE